MTFTMSRSRVERLLRLLATNPETVKYLGLEAAWSARPRAIPLAPLSWPLPTEKLAETTIRWPVPVPLPDAGWWEGKLRAGLAAHVQVLPAQIDHPFTSILMFDVAVRGRAHRIAIDYRDSSLIPHECAMSAALYFKLQFANEGYPWEHVVPGGYVVGQQKFYRYLARLRALRQRQPVFDVYGRFGKRGENLRRKVIGLLEDQDVFDFTGGLRTVIYGQSLCEAARAKVSVDLPGHGWLCYRLMEYLGIGSCVVAIPHGNRLHVPLVDREHLVYTRPDGEDIVELCQYYLHHVNERSAIIEKSQDYFDRYLHYRQLGAYYLSVIFDRIY
jgi:hypothetical protein